jgi:hypothetical protein
MPGKSMQYQHMNVPDKVIGISKPHFISVIRNQKIIGTCVFCQRENTSTDETITSFYIRYFSIDAMFRRKYVKIKNTAKSGLIKREIKSLLDGKSLVAGRTKFYFYAYVDYANARSKSLCEEFGFEPVRQYTTVIFNRINPSEQINVHQISHEGESKIRELIVGFNKGHNMFSIENLFKGKPYYVIRDLNEGIVAGAQVNPDSWKIFSLPGFIGNSMLNVFTHVPILNKLMSKNYRFLTLEGVFFKPGFEASIEPFSKQYWQNTK